MRLPLRATQSWMALLNLELLLGCQRQLDEVKPTEPTPLSHLLAATQAEFTKQQLEAKPLDNYTPSADLRWQPR